MYNSNTFIPICCNTGTRIYSTGSYYTGTVKNSVSNSIDNFQLDSNYQGCTNCGAPGQKIGYRCEYCKCYIEVSKVTSQCNIVYVKHSVNSTIVGFSTK